MGSCWGPEETSGGVRDGDGRLERPPAEPRQDDGRGELEDGERAALAVGRSHAGKGGCQRRGRGSAPSCRMGGVLERSWWPGDGGMGATARRA
ncbi:unnamed protein product [Gulo gulo]|uniref:Uncharacterized protein n=1 Tax=Gulo gulo TaxID=48420 RepID=A0A9X9LET5_GULGU|nr:unnamed protein product [Gulo gulo]